MAWLEYSDGEVSRFHPEFECIANRVLVDIGLTHSLEWIHHNRTPGNTVVPDFILRDRDTQRWLAAVEIKRTRDGVFSTRNQVQAQGYATINANHYSAGRPLYFAITNLEVTVLFAVNGERPPSECRLIDGLYDSGSFLTTPTQVHNDSFANDLSRMIRLFKDGRAPEFDTVWPSILKELDTFATGNEPFPAGMIVSKPVSPNWALVERLFCEPIEVDSRRLLYLRCLMAEYLRGILLRHNHPQAATIPPLRTDVDSLANTIAGLNAIDFSHLFEAGIQSRYRTLAEPIRSSLTRYLRKITTGAHVVNLAQSRVDALQLVDSLITQFYPVTVRDQRGKVQTDPDLADLLSCLAISRSDSKTIDPCCGDGALLSSAYNRLLNCGATHVHALSNLSGIEADPIATRLAQVRLALKAPASISPQPAIKIDQGDMFCSRTRIAEHDVVLMNPPFLRYEEQAGRRTPEGLREHYEIEIAGTGNTATSSAGQPNLFNFYVEFVIRCLNEGAVLAVILDNKWYHNKYGIALRTLLKEKCDILGIIEYPHNIFFKSWTIATSILVARKRACPSEGHGVKFVSVKVDPRGVDLHQLSEAFRGEAEWPTDWTCNVVRQVELSPKNGWKPYFRSSLVNEYRLPEWPTVSEIFRECRRGSLEKEGAGIGILEFPFNRSNYGPRREVKPNRVGYQTNIGTPLTSQQNERLRDLASRIPATFRGHALKNSDGLSGYELSDTDVTTVETLEPPVLRAHPELFRSRRTDWSRYHEQALIEMRQDPALGSFIAEVENSVNLTEQVLPREMLWNVLREPVAGELIVPRKLRSGHRVHLNMSALNTALPQLRISSNFLTFVDCLAADEQSGLSTIDAVRLTAAFLVSSFGQLQFEMEGYNREGCLCVEKDHFSRIKIFDPRWVRTISRQAILAAYQALPYPISTSILSSEQAERTLLDRLFADEISTRYPAFNASGLLADVHLNLDAWLIARNP